MNFAIINAFTQQPFHGNPAAVCFLNERKEENWMQSVAKEINMPTTAFISPDKDGFQLRWFTPTTEIHICGHGTLAASYILWTKGFEEKDKPIYFTTKSGRLAARWIDGWVQLEFPINLEESIVVPELLIQALNVKPIYVGKSSIDYLVEVESEEIVKNLNPNFDLMAQLPVRGVIVTSRSNSNAYDFVSRFFSPSQGIPEDYVNGSSHCCLGPYWKKKLDRSELTAYQASERGGVLKLRVLDQTVFLSGQAVTVLEGNFTI